MINVSLIGRLGYDPSVHTTNSGTAIHNFSLACDTGYGQHKKTEWFKCSVFEGARCSKAVEYLKKGKPIFVTGALSSREFTTKNNTQGFSMEIVVDNISFISTGNPDQKQENRAEENNCYPSNEQKSEPISPSSSSGWNNDIPF